jgi:hypothetical protein
MKTNMANNDNFFKENGLVMERRIIISMVMLVFTMACMAQSITSDQLKNGAWQEVLHDENEKIIEIYNDSARVIVYSIFWKGKWDTLRDTAQLYYLSDTIPKSFDFTKVGKPSKGKYQVRWVLKRKIMRVNKIENYSDSILELDNGRILRRIKNGF